MSIREQRHSLPYIPKNLSTAVRAYGMYDRVYHVYAMYSMMTNTEEYASGSAVDNSRNIEMRTQGQDLSVGDVIEYQYHWI